MAEAEDVLHDVARHATVYVRDLWRRNRPAPVRPVTALDDVAQRLDLLIAAIFRRSFALRIAIPPAPRNALRRFYERGQGPQPTQAVPATDDRSIWLPRELDMPDREAATERYRVFALQQAMRAVRGSARGIPADEDALVRACYQLCEAAAADVALVQLLPGLASGIGTLRREALTQRPPLDTFPARRRPLEALLRELLAHDCLSLPPCWPTLDTPVASLAHAREIAAALRDDIPDAHRLRGVWLLPDAWTGELRPVAAAASVRDRHPDDEEDDTRDHNPRSARMDRRPAVREALPDEDEPQDPGAWMIQPGEPLEQAEDPMGMQRPTDRDEKTAAEELADSLSELNEARLVSTPGTPKEILLSDDAPEARVKGGTHAAPTDGDGIEYPEWDYRMAAYREPGARVIVLPPTAGDPAWVEKTLKAHRAMLDAIRRRFELLRAQRMRLRRQRDGEDIDLDAYIESIADYRAGRSLSQRLYQTTRQARRDTAIALLIDISGSTDAWVASHRRVIDVEREALLLVCLALESMGEPYCVQAFSGEGPDCVTVRELKRFDEHYGADVGTRIAALEPERYTRAGAAIRHAAATLMRKPASHRLLMLLSDGKPNDMDEYDGRYGVEDMRQAVTEVKLQGISPFCLTIDRQGASYLPQVFGVGNYALLMQPAELPSALIDWIRRLVAH